MTHTCIADIAVWLNYAMIKMPRNPLHAAYNDFDTNREMKLYLCEVIVLGRFLLIIIIQVCHCCFPFRYIELMIIMGKWHNNYLW